MEIQHSFNKSDGRFFIKEEGKLLAEMTYEIKSDNVILITHTEVSDQLEHKGIGRKMLALTVELARESKMELRSICTFAKSILDKTEEYHDVYKIK